MHGVEMTIREMTGQLVGITDDIDAGSGMNIENGDLVAIKEVRKSALASIPSTQIENTLKGLAGDLFKEPRIEFC